MPANTEHLKTLVQDLINDRHSQAEVTMHDYFVAKTKEVSGMRDPEEVTEVQDPEDDEEFEEDEEVTEAMKVQPAPLSAAQKRSILKNFKSWSGGLAPKDAADKIGKFVRTSADADLDAKAVKAYLQSLTEGFDLDLDD
jgi:hypothetical protein